MSEATRGLFQRRLLQLLAEMMDGNALTRNDASKRFGMHADHAYRCLVLLEEEVPGVSGRKRDRCREFYFDAAKLPQREPLRTPVVGFSEALAASFAAAFARVFHGTEYEQRLLNYRSDVISCLSASKKRNFSEIGRKIFIRSNHEELLSDRQGLLEDVLDGVLRQKVIRMHYRHFDGRAENVEVKPYSLAVYDGHLYVVGASHEAASYPFRFARIEDLDVTNLTFEYPAVNEYDPEVVFRDSLGIFVDPEPCKVTVRFAPLWAVFVRHHRWHPSQRIERELSDGSLVVSMHVRPCKELEQWVLGLGEHAEVLEPEALRASISARLRAAASRYATKFEGHEASA